MFDLLYFGIANIIEIFVFAKHLQENLRAKCIWAIVARMSVDSLTANHSIS